MQAEDSDQGTLTVTGEIEMLTMLTLVLAGMIGGEDALDATADDIEAVLAEDEDLADIAETA